MNINVLDSMEEIDDNVSTSLSGEREMLEDFTYISRKIVCHPVVQRALESVSRIENHVNNILNGLENLDEIQTAHSSKHNEKSKIELTDEAEVPHGDICSVIEGDHERVESSLTDTRTVQNVTFDNMVTEIRQNDRDNAQCGLDNKNDSTFQSLDAIKSTLIHEWKSLVCQLAELRGNNRDALLTARQAKGATAVARVGMDALHLDLQNLFYEQRRLAMEIARCEAYEHKYQQLSLLPEHEFIEAFPEHANADSHSLTIARIRHEFVERQALEERRQGLLKLKQGLIAENKQIRDDLIQIDHDLTHFFRTAHPIIRRFDQKY